MANLMNLTKMIPTLAAAASENAGSTVTYRQSYHEISDRHVVEMDVIEQLRANLTQLEDLHGRLRFAMSEIVYLTKKS